MSTDRTVTIAFENASSSGVSVTSFSPPPSSWVSGKTPCLGQEIDAQSSQEWATFAPMLNLLQGDLILQILAGGSLTISWYWPYGDKPQGGATVQGTGFTVTSGLSNVGQSDVVLSVTLTDS